MDLVIIEFEEKVEEINEYFSFIEKTTHLRLDINEEMIEVTQTVFNTLKSSLFLLLYNLIEASFRKSLEKICYQIKQDNLKYKEVVPAIKKNWIEKKYKNFENIKTPQNMQKSEFIMKTIDSIAEDTIRIISKNELSGNVTPSVIKESVNKYGLVLEDISEEDDNHPLCTIKDRRNWLAHGNQSFNECSRDTTIEELKIIKNKSIEYMSFILEHIKDFTDNKKYKLEESL